MTTTATADLEIALSRIGADAPGGQPELEVSCRLMLPTRDGAIDPLDGARPVARFDLDRLRALSLDPVESGRELGRSLFGDPAVRGVLDRALADAGQQPLRLRLTIDARDAWLHQLRWELLADPRGTRHLFQGDRISFSRYLTVSEARPDRRPTLSGLRGLVVAANPADLGKYEERGERLAPVDVARFRDTARRALGGIRVRWLGSGRATWDDLSAGLDQGVDILCLVCHGSLRDGRSILWLEGEGGAVDHVDGDLFVRRIAGLETVPRLVVLASCQSAGGGRPAWGEENALAALGPRLVAAGVPAVLAMHGDVGMETTHALLPVFFEELTRDGQIDRALGIARAAVARQPDWWMPVLFMRLQSGQLWFPPTTSDERFARWPSLISAIERGICVPILGPGLQDALLGSRRKIARRWAADNGFPMAAHQQYELPQVAQFLKTKQNLRFVADKLLEYLTERVWDKYGDELADAPFDASLSELLTTLGRRRRANNPTDPYAVLAGFPVSLFINTSPNDLLRDALCEAGKHPQQAICRSDTVPGDPIRVEWRGADVPESVEHPLIFHPFGHLTAGQERGENGAESLVLTEDDYFRFLIKITLGRGDTRSATPAREAAGVSPDQRGDGVPSSVGSAVTNRTLLFLGFKINDWTFRVLLRFIMEYPNITRRDSLTHVAVQIEPDEDELQDRAQALAYLEEYLRISNIFVFRGTVESFLTEVHERLQASREQAGRGRHDP
jgi:hypothetical protein